MKQFRCIFSYPHGKTTADLPADDAESAMKRAVRIVADLKVSTVEIWQDNQLVRTRRLQAQALQ
jgi:hypothetical protein